MIIQLVLPPGSTIDGRADTCTTTGCVRPSMPPSRAAAQMRSFLSLTESSEKAADAARTSATFSSC